MVAAAALSLAISSYAQDAAPEPTKPASDFRPTDGLENWTYEYDVGPLKPGTYNVLARATDSAGNVAFAAPFNLIVDPASDLPVSGFVNPLPLARVGADLNVVGVCVDDDAVGRVELRLDDGEWTQARGTDYWSYYLPTAGMADGLHALSARGVDVNGLAGPESRVEFHLDRTKPLHDVRSPAFGAIASGKLGVSGSVYDANGLASVSYSMDSGATWAPLRHSYDKKAMTASFSLSVDTKKMPDGPAVLWLRSVDGVGSEGVAVFLYFIDNTRPELDILSPGQGESVNGRFFVRGRVFDTVGVRSLTWSYGKETGTVELLPGNPYFSLPFDAPAKAGPVVITLTATDVAGNATAGLAKLFETTHKAQAEGKVIDKALYDKARDYYEEAFYRSLFIGAENSVGFHNPTEAMRVLGDSIAFATKAEGFLRQALAKAGVEVPLKIDLELSKYLDDRGEKKIKWDKSQEFKDPSGVQDMF